MPIAIERVELAVTVTDPGDADTPAWRDTIRVEVEGVSVTATQLTALRKAATIEAQERHAAWLDAVRNPPVPDPADAPSRDEMLDAAAVALEQALATITAVKDAAELDAEAVVP